MTEKRGFSKIIYSLFLAGILIICPVLSACGDAAKTEEKEAADEEAAVQIGMIFDNFIMERWQRDRDVFVSTAKELGAEVNVQNANSSVEEQIALMEYFMEKKVDVIVLIPIDSQPLVPYVDRAQDAGIKVICYDRLVVGAQPDLYISFDNVQVGRLMAEALSKEVEKEEQVLMLCGPLTDHNVIEVEKGFREVMEEKDILIQDVFYAEEWKAENAADYVRQKGPLISEIEGIMCGNDYLAGEVVGALAEQRLAGKIYVAGQDADLPACQRIMEGTQLMTVYKPVENLAARAAEAAVGMANKEVVTEEIYISADGREIPYICLEPIKITKDNMQEVIIDGGFHLKEDVYLNRPDLLK